MAENAKKKEKPEEPLIPLYMPADAVAKEAQPGYKAGNPVIDRVNENSKREAFFRKFRDFYKKFVRIKK